MNLKDNYTLWFEKQKDNRNAIGQTKTSAPQDNQKFDFSNYDFSNAGKIKKKVLQPLWKWSYDGKELMIWPVDEEYGQPHHIEMTGMQFYLLAQGRVYRDNQGDYEILVWEDRGTEEMQEDAVEAVDDWLWAHVGKEATYIDYQSEGGIYQTLDPENPDLNKMMTAYFGYPVKVKNTDDPLGSAVKTK